MNEFPRRARAVIIGGGPLTNSNPSVVLPFVDLLIVGEAEALLPEAIARILDARNRYQAIEAVAALPHCIRGEIEPGQLEDIPTMANAPAVLEAYLIADDADAVLAIAEAATTADEFESAVQTLGAMNATEQLRALRGTKGMSETLIEAYAVAGANGLNWGALANCESGGNPRAVNPAGYYGLYQFDLGTWRSVGGSGLPTAASAGEQTFRAKLLYKQRGRSPWPTCGRLL